MRKITRCSFWNVFSVTQWDRLGANDNQSLLTENEQQVQLHHNYIHVQMYTLFLTSTNFSSLQRHVKTVKKWKSLTSNRNFARIKLRIDSFADRETTFMRFLTILRQSRCHNRFKSWFSKTKTACIPLGIYLPVLVISSTHELLCPSFQLKSGIFNHERLKQHGEKR